MVRPLESSLKFSQLFTFFGGKRDFERSASAKGIIYQHRLTLLDCITIICTLPHTHSRILTGTLAHPHTSS
jgi:hypothetical protein